MKIKIILLLLSISKISFSQNDNNTILRISPRRIEITPARRIEIQPTSNALLSGQNLKNVSFVNNSDMLTTDSLFGKSKIDSSKYFLVEKSFIENLQNFLKELTKTSLQHNLLISRLKKQNADDKEFLESSTKLLQNNNNLNSKIEKIQNEINEIKSTDKQNSNETRILRTNNLSQEEPILETKEQSKNNSQVDLETLNNVINAKITIPETQNNNNANNIKPNEKNIVSPKKEETIITATTLPLTVTQITKPINEVKIKEQKSISIPLPTSLDPETNPKPKTLPIEINTVKSPQSNLKINATTLPAQTTLVKPSTQNKVVEAKTLPLITTLVPKPVNNNNTKKQEDEFFSSGFSNFDNNFDFDNFIEKPQNEVQKKLDPKINLDTKKAIPTLKNFPSFSDFLKTGQLPEIPGVPLPRSVSEIKESGLSEKDLENQMKEFLDKIRKGEIKPPSS